MHACTRARPYIILYIYIDHNIYINYIIHTAILFHAFIYNITLYGIFVVEIILRI